MTPDTHSVGSEPTDSTTATVACWRVYPEQPGLFADESTPADNSILIRQDEETDEYLRGNVAHPRFGAGLQTATFQKDKLVGWREETVVPEWPETLSPSRWAKLIRAIRSLVSDRRADSDSDRTP